MKSICTLIALLALTACVSTSETELTEQCKITGDTVIVVSILDTEHKYTYFSTCNDAACEPHHSWYVHNVLVREVLRGDVREGATKIAVSELGREISRLENQSESAVTVSIENIDDLEADSRVNAKYVLVDYCVSQK